MNTGSWQSDPARRHQYRYWNGTEWTDQVSDNGVVGNDPIVMPTPVAPSHSEWKPPTATSPAATTARNKRRGAMIGIAALVAAGIVTVVYLQRDDSSGKPAVTTSTSVPATSTTLLPTTTTTPTTTPLTTPVTTPVTTPAIDAAALVAAMPTDAEVPTEWIRYHEPHPETDLSGSGVCSGPSDHARATQAGSVTIADGPRWDLPNNGWFGIDLYHFATESAAQAFLAATIAQANGCTTTPLTWQESEGDWGMAGDWMPDDTMWQMTGTAVGSEESTVNADQHVRVLGEQRGSVTYDGVLYTAALRYIDQWERDGLVVIDFWIGGDWGETGWDSFDGAYQPTDADLSAAADAVRAGIISRLAAIGAL